MGRPKKEIDKKMFEKLWLLGVQKDGYLYVFDCSSEELDTFCVNAYGLDFESLKKEIEYAEHPNKDKDYPYMGEWERLLEQFAFYKSYSKLWLG